MADLVVVVKEGGGFKVAVIHEDNSVMEFDIGTVYLEDTSGMFQLVSDGYCVFVEGVQMRDDSEITWC